jgi:alpha-beta hydrolase superfamily lysophospholipase
VKRALLEDLPFPEISRHPVASGKEVLDAVFVAPAGEPAHAAVLICHGIAESVDHWFRVQRLLAAQGVASAVNECPLRNEETK